MMTEAQLKKMKKDDLIELLLELMEKLEYMEDNEKKLSELEYLLEQRKIESERVSLGVEFAREELRLIDDQLELLA